MPIWRAVPARMRISGVWVGRVEIGHLLLGDFEELGAGKLGDLLLVWLTGAGSDAGCLLEEGCCGWLLGDEGEALVFKDGDHYWKDVAVLLLRGGVERLAEFHDVHTSLTEGGTDGWGWVCFACSDLQLESFDDFFSHGFLGYFKRLCVV